MHQFFSKLTKTGELNGKRQQDECMCVKYCHARPHSPEKYIELIRTTYKLRRIVSSRGVHGALIGSLYPLDKLNPLNGLTGEIYRFIQLDPNEPWFNVQNNEAAKEDELKEIKIPDHLKPHLARFSFVFFPRGHRFYIELRRNGKTIGPSTVSAIMKALLSDAKLEIFGDIEVTVEPDNRGSTVRPQKSAFFPCTPSNHAG
jgi:hypothetical protein